MASAGDGREAIDKIKKADKLGKRFSLVVTDINMPRMDGFTFIKKFRQHDQYTPLLILSSMSDKTQINKGKELGASGWIIKPFGREKLEKVIKKLI